MTPTKQQVIDYRKQFKLSQAEAAEQTGLSPRTWQRIEYGQQAMPLNAWYMFLTVNMNKLWSSINV